MNNNNQSLQPSCSRCGRTPNIVATKPGQTVFDLLLGVCPTCNQAFCTECALDEGSGYICPVHKKELDIL